MHFYRPAHLHRHCCAVPHAAVAPAKAARPDHRPQLNFFQLLQHPGKRGGEGRPIMSHTVQFVRVFLRWPPGYWMNDGCWQACSMDLQAPNSMDKI